MRHKPKMKSNKTPQPVKSQNWWGLDLLVIIALPSIDTMEGQILTAVHSGFNMWIIGYLIAGCLLGLAIFLRVNEHYVKIKKLSNWTSKRKYIRYLPTIGIGILIIIRLISPALGESNMTQNVNIENSVLYQDGLHGNVYINKTLGFKIERPDDTWQFITDIPKFREIYKFHYNNPIGFLGGVMVGKSFIHNSVAIWVLDPVAVRFSNMSDFVNKTLTDIPPVIHNQLYNIREDVSTDGNYGTYTFDSNGINGSMLHYEGVIEMSNGKLYERTTLIPNTLSKEDVNDIKFIIDHFEILN